MEVELSICDSVSLEEISNYHTKFFSILFAGIVSTTNSVTGIDAMCPASKDDFTEFEKLLKEKICQFEKSVHYSSFLESLFRELCISCKLSIYCSHFTEQC